MNERIRELIQAADRQCSETRGVYDEILAKLIVKECYVHCGGQLMDKTLAEAHGLTYNDGVMDCAIGLLQHFGVEE